MHHAMFMLVCLPYCLLLFGLLLSLASVSFRSCEDSFVYDWFGFIRSSSSWTHSSSLRDFRQDDRHLGSHYYHCYASCFVLSLCCATYLLLIKPPKLPWTSNLWHFLANHCLAMLPLCSAPLIALLVAGEDWSLFLVGTWRCCSLLEHVYLLGYHNISYLINASIYLVKGGRLGLMPGVLFHSCRPSFRHIGVMFPDFVFLTRLGYNGNPLIVRLD